MNLKDALIEFLDDCELEELSPNTISWYRKLLSKFIEWNGDDTPFADVKRADVKDFLKFKKGQGRALSTVQGYRRAIRVFFNWGVYEGYIPFSPVQRMRTKGKQPEVKRISMKAVQQLLDACKADEDTLASMRDRAMIVILWDTGCRAGELLGLRLDDIDWEKETVFFSGKTGDRTVPLEPDALTALSDWLNVRPTDHETDAIFLTLRRGFKGALGYSGLRIMLQRRASEAEIGEPVNPHAFRHGFCSEYMRRGGDWGVLADTVGHTDSNTTKKYYIRFRGDALKGPHARFSPTNGLDV